MPNFKQRKLESAVAAIQQQHGTRALQKGKTFPKERKPSGISTGFPVLDQITGCGGVPVSRMTLLSGQTTSGKLTLAYKLLANAQRKGRAKKATQPVAIIDLNQTSDPDYLARCGVCLDHLAIAYPQPNAEAVRLLFDMVQQQRDGQQGVRFILVDGIANISRARRAMRALDSRAGRLARSLRNSDCTLLFIDEPAPPWQRWLNLDRSHAIRNHAALHIELRREHWLHRHNQLTGYQATAQIIKSRWASKGKAASIAIEFNGTVRAAQTY